MTPELEAQIEMKLRKILGEDDYKYTDKPSKIIDLITTSTTLARIDELTKAVNLKVSHADGYMMALAMYSDDRIKALKEGNNE